MPLSETGTERQWELRTGTERKGFEEVEYKIFNLYYLYTWPLSLPRVSEYRLLGVQGH